MDNPHELIAGYRDLSAAEIKAINDAKELGVLVGELCDEIGRIEGVDTRWLAIARTDLQKGFMALVRAIAKPTVF